MSLLHNRKFKAGNVKKRPVKKIIQVILAVFLTSFILLECLIIFNGNLNNREETDIVIILGAGLRGETPSLALLERLNSGIVYLNRYPDMKVIVSGGQGRGEDIAEALAMKRYLLENGIGEDRILIEDASTSTMENFAFSKPIIQATLGRDAKRITVVTNSFHMLRAMMLAKRNGFIPYGISAVTPPQVIIQSHVREYLALIKSYFIDRLPFS